MANPINPAVYWTNVALEANRRDFSVPDGKTAAAPEQGGPTLSSRALAIVHLAMHDAYFSVLGTQPIPGTDLTWLPGLAAPATVGHPETCMGAAALAALRALYKSPEQKAAFDKAMLEFMPSVPMTAEDAAWGQEVANQVLAARAADVNNAGQAYGLSDAPYHHRSDPFSKGQTPHGQLWGNCPAFVVPLQNLAPPPSPALIGPNAFYDTEFEDVRLLGVQNGSDRDAEETVQGIFWAYDGADKIGTPPRLYCQIALTIMEKFETAAPGTVETADYVRLLALMTTAMADAGIQAWHWKYEYDLWRPVVGIREADTCLGPNTTTPGKIVKAHTDWAPLGAPGTNQGTRSTPGFPAYPSGHATFGAAAFQVIRRYAELKGFAPAPAGGDGEEDLIKFDFISDEYNGMNRDSDNSVRPKHLRHFNSLWEATVENSVSRVYLGVHWRFDGITKKGPGGNAIHANPPPAKPSELGDIGGVALGRKIANELMTIGLKKA